MGHRLIDDATQAFSHLWQITIANGFNKKLTQRLVVEDGPASQHMEELSHVRLAHLVDLREQCTEDVALSSPCGHQVPQVTDFCLSNSMDTPETLLNPIRIPWQVIVHHEVSTL